VRDDVEEALKRNLRAKFDVDVQVLEPERIRELGAEYPRSVGFRVTPVSITGESPPSLPSCQRALVDYLETIGELSDGGIDPLVFLGVKRSPRDGGSRETPDPRITSPGTDVEDDEDSFLLVADEDSDASDSDGEFVLAAPEFDDSDPLQTGRFDDHRLDEPDATSALVDVVLRHPGYSDRRVGQVLSILFSIEYFEALGLMQNAPIVVARGVSRDRGQTIQTVVEAAGGRVKLTEPDRFPASE